MIDRRRAVLGLAALAGACAHRGDASGAARALQALVEGPDGVMGAGIIARDGGGRVRFEGAAGLALTEGRLRPYDLESPARVASISKLVAMTAVMTLVEDGRLDLDADVSRPLGFRLRHPARPQTPITARMLAAHTAGLRNGPTFPQPLGRRIEGVFAPGWDDGAWFAPASKPPGVFAYADINIALLATLAERITGERFDRFAARRVLEPLGLDAGFNWSGVSDAERARATACARRLDGVWTAEVDATVPPAPAIRVFPAPESPHLTADDYRIGDNGFVFSPQGGLRASVRDLDRLARAYAGGGAPILKPGTLAEMARPAWVYDPAAPNGLTERGLYRAYGLCVHVPTGTAGQDAFFGPGSADWRGHFGEAYGLLSGLFWNRRDGSTLAWTIAGTPSEPAEAPGTRSALTRWEERLIDVGLEGAS